MLKKLIKILVIIIFACVCFIKINNQKETKLIHKYISNPTKYNYLNYEVLEISKINLLEKIEINKDNFANLDNSLIYYEKLNYNNRIIIFGHSGMGYNKYFNRLDELKINDIAYLYYNDLKLEYILKEIYTVSEYETDIMSNTVDKKELILITCVKNQKSQRLVLKFDMKNIKNIDK